MHGDSHYFRIDKPLLDSQGLRVENFTRVETFGDHAEGGTNDVNWVKVRVDPEQPGGVRLPAAGRAGQPDGAASGRSLTRSQDLRGGSQIGAPAPLGAETPANATVPSAIQPDVADSGSDSAFEAGMTPGGPSPGMRAQHSATRTLSRSDQVV